ncbi:TPA: hypothetical protein ACH3X3_010105 [Trebouxia sp. C0006]
MAVNGPHMITAVLEHLRPEDVELLLANRGLPSVGGKEELAERLQSALCNEICEWEWETGDVPEFHCEMVGAGASMATHNNCIYVFGGMDEERAEHMYLWRWDLSSEAGFEPITHRGAIPPKLTAGHYSAVYGDELWVFPNPRNHNLRRVYCCDLMRYRWTERDVRGDPPNLSEARRNMDCFLDGKRLIVFGGPQMQRIWFFDFESRQWSSRLTSGGRNDWTFGHAIRRSKYMYAYGTHHGAQTEESVAEIWQLDLVTFHWNQVACKGSLPPYRVHTSSAVVENRWILHGGRIPAPATQFNVQNQSYVLNLNTWRWSALMAEGCVPVAREWQKALGLQDCMVVVGGRVSIPGEEPIPVTCDQMSKSVEILWWKPPPQQQQPTGKVQMLNSVMELYNNTHLSDMTLIVEDRQIPAHRHVLATHSSMFDRMWNHSMKEVETSEVHISDFDYDTISWMLRYMYGCLELSPQNLSHAKVLELFKAADKYDVPGLVKECVQIFRKITRSADVAPLLQVAHERSSTELQAVCMEVAGECLPNVVVTASFKALTQIQPDMAMSFVSEVAKKMGMSHKECDAAETDADGAKLENGQDTMPEYMAASPENSDMDIDSNRRQH